MADVVAQSRKAQLGTQIGTDKFKVNAYLCLWGLVIGGLCFFMASDNGSSLFYIPGVIVFMAALAANGMIWSGKEEIRRLGYYINLLFQGLILLLIIPVFLLSLRFGFAVAVLWYWNPAVSILKNDQELTALQSPAPSASAKSSNKGGGGGTGFNAKPKLSPSAKPSKP